MEISDCVRRGIGQRWARACQGRGTPTQGGKCDISPYSPQPLACDPVCSSRFSPRSCSPPPLVITARGWPGVQGSVAAPLPPGATASTRGGRAGGAATATATVVIALTTTMLVVQAARFFCSGSGSMVGKYSYQYARPSLTVDAVIASTSSPHSLLLIQVSLLAG